MTQFLRKLLFKKKRGIVLGGAGSLGSAIVSRFQKDWEMTSIDFYENRSARVNILLNQMKDPEDHIKQIKEKISGKYDLIINTAGVWCQGNVSEPNIRDEMELNLRGNFYSSIVAAHLATSYLTEMGTLIFSGSLLAYKETTPSMLAYGVSKNMVHSLALNMSSRKDLTSENIVICLLPDTLNTEVNRKAMPSADFSKWAQPEQISDLVYMWNKGINTPKNGSFVTFKVGKELTQEYL